MEVRELRLEGGARLRDGGGGGGDGFGWPFRTAYVTDMVAGEGVDGPGVGRFGSLGGEGRRTNSAQSFETDDALGLITE